MIKKFILTAIISLHILILPTKSIRAQFSELDIISAFDFASFLIGYAPLPDLARAGLFVLDLSTVPFRDTSREIEHGSPNIIEVSDLYNNRSETLLYPDSDKSEYKSFQSYVKKLSSGQFGFGFAKFVYKSRTILGTGGMAENSLIGEKYYDSQPIEGYLDFEMPANATLFFGQRNKAFGHSLGINPASVFYNNKPTNYNLPLERKHMENPGVYTLGSDIYSNWGDITFMASQGDPDSIFNSEDNLYLSYGTLIGSEPIDLRLFSFYDGEPLAGISASAPAPHGFTLYTDLAVKQGEGIQRVLKESEAGVIELDTEENSQIITNLTVGMNYALGPNMLINAEYSHLSNGYDETEWTNYFAALEDNSSGGKKLKEGIFEHLVDFYEASYLRRDYGYLRFYTQDTFGSGIRTELATMLGLNDFSGRVDLNLSRNITDAYSVEAYAGYNFGQSDGEFALARENIFAGASIVAKY